MTYLLLGHSPNSQILLRRHKNIVRRVLGNHYRPEPNSCGPPRLTFLGQTKDRLRSADLFRCESATLRTHWILVVVDQYSRRIIGFGVQAGADDGVAISCMFNHAIGGHRAMPKYLSSDQEPHFLFERWRANLRILDVAEAKTLPYIPLSRPFMGRLIGTIRRESLDRTLFWTSVDLENKLVEFRNDYNRHRTHASPEDEHGIRARACCGRSPTSIPTDGNPTARVSIRHG